MGTALGEIPPYAVSYQATKLGKRTAEIDLALEQHDPLTPTTNVLTSLAAQTREWMISCIKQHGFWGVLLLSAWPNAAFDLCGICCGAFMMPFWEFLGATLVGKGIIKVHGQTGFFVLLFRRQSRDMLMHWLDLVLPRRVLFFTSSIIGDSGEVVSPAHLLNATLSRRIAEFQAAVAHREAARHADPRCVGFVGFLFVACLLGGC